MQDLPEEPPLPPNDISAVESFAGGAIAIVFAVFWFFFMWRYMKAIFSTPRQLERIATALERIADNIDRKM
ncbi:MAG: hypothetical protein AAF224_06675 [Pseudomonadota bacterium]